MMVVVEVLVLQAGSINVGRSRIGESQILEGTTLM